MTNEGAWVIGRRTASAYAACVYGSSTQELNVGIAKMCGKYLRGIRTWKWWELTVRIAKTWGQGCSSNAAASV